MSNNHQVAQEPKQPETRGKNIGNTVWFLVLCVLAVVVAGVLPQALLG